MIDTLNIAELSDMVKNLQLNGTGSGLPEVDTTDEGKVLTVNSEGEWDAEDIPSELPEVTSAEAGEVLMVGDDGEWETAEIVVELPDIANDGQEVEMGYNYLGKPVYRKLVQYGESGTGTLNGAAFNVGESVEAVVGCKVWYVMNSMYHFANATDAFVQTIGATTVYVTAYSGNVDKNTCFALIEYTKHTS